MPSLISPLQFVYRVLLVCSCGIPIGTTDQNKIIWSLLLFLLWPQGLEFFAGIAVHSVGGFETFSFDLKT